MLHCCVEAGLDTCTSLLQTMNRVIAPRALGQELRHVLGISGATSGLASIPTLGDRALPLSKGLINLLPARLYGCLIQGIL